MVTLLMSAQVLDAWTAVLSLPDSELAGTAIAVETACSSPDCNVSLGPMRNEALR